MTLKIITDSACDLPDAIIKEYDIDVLPFLIYIDDVEHRDGSISLPNKSMMQSVKIKPQPPVKCPWAKS